MIRSSAGSGRENTDNKPATKGDIESIKSLINARFSELNDRCDRLDDKIDQRFNSLFNMLNEAMPAE